STLTGTEMSALVLVFYFFFSSRRRHTRWPRDWSSDVCSSDLVESEAYDKCSKLFSSHPDLAGIYVTTEASMPVVRAAQDAHVLRSEERRVGKECRYWWSGYQQ